MPDELNASFDETASPAEPVEETVVVEDSLGNQFLSKIPEQDRPIVGKYVKDWDGNVTKKFQELHERYKPYKDLGDPTEVQQAYQFYNHFKTNGESMLGNMVKAFYQHYGDQAPARLNQLLGVDVSNEDWEYEEEGDEEIDPNEAFQQNVQAELEELRSFRETYEQQQIEAQVNQQLDATLAAMHNERPEIPQDFLVQGIASGATPQQILSLYDQIAASRGSQSSPRNPPPVMGGQGGVPSGQVDVSKLDAKGRKALAMQYLESAGQ